MKRYALIPTSLPGYIEGLLFILLAHVFFLAEGIQWDKEHLYFKSTWRPWVEKHWHYSTTLGHGTIYQSKAGDRIHQHEPIHIRQIDDMLILSFIIGILCGAAAGSFWWFLGIWCSGIAWQLPNFLTAWLRGGDPYRDSEHERSAYAQTDRNTPAGMDWLSTHRGV